MKATVTVQGTGVVSAQPDEVRLMLEISAQRPKPEAALAEVAQRSEALAQVLDGLDVPAARRTTSGASVSDVWEYDKQGNRSQAGYRASNSLILRLDDGSILGKLMNHATEKAGAKITAPGGTSPRTTPPGLWPVNGRRPSLARKPRDMRRRWECVSPAC